MRTYIISIGKNRHDTNWRPKEVTWEKLCERLKNVRRTPETAEMYSKMSKPEKGAIKDVGGFVGGSINGGHRKAANMLKRSLITLDIDYGKADTLDRIRACVKTSWLVYSTHSHTEQTPRYRLVMPINRDVEIDEYEPIARKVAESIGIDVFDTSTYEASRLMYWPSASSDAPYVCEVGGEGELDADAVLDCYTDWRNPAEWPMDGDTRLTIARGNKQKDPLKKPGMVGAFCRSYTISEAIERFIPDAYERVSDNRWTYRSGTTAGGMITYDDIYAYSHHGTDPAGGKLCNAFDLIRLHLFGHEDGLATEHTPANKVPSYLKMEDLCQRDQKVAGRRASETLDAIDKEYAEVDLEGNPVDVSWRERLHVDKKGKTVADPHNFELILTNDARLENCTVYNCFEDRNLLTRDLPWRNIGHEQVWCNADDAGLQAYISTHYKLQGKQALLDMWELVCSRRQIHPLRDYLNNLKWDGTKRLETLIIDYLGAEDNELTRAMTRKHFTAAVARIFEPGTKYDYVLTLIGAEGLGKSSIIRYMGLEKWHSDSLTTIDGREAMENLRGKWLVEMGELTNYKNSTSEAYKAFLSKQDDSYRPAYGRRTEVYKRQCVFFATTNENEFLKGSTGNRRFWTIQCGENFCTKDIHEDLPNEVDQLWAEAVHYYNEGEKLYLPPALEMEARKRQEVHNEMSVDDRIGVIVEFLNRPLPAGWYDMPIEWRANYFKVANSDAEDDASFKRQKISAVEIYCECFGQKLDEKTRYKTKDINTMLRFLKAEGIIKEGLRERVKGYGQQRTYIIINNQ